MKARYCQLLSSIVAWHHHSPASGTDSRHIFGRSRSAAVRPSQTSALDLLQARTSCADTLSPISAEETSHDSDRSV